MIRSFGDRGTEDIYHGINSSRARKTLPRSLHKLAARKLDLLDGTETLHDLLVPPGNQLESLRGNLRGRYSIRINGQWRIVFKWEGTYAEEVQIMDYH